MPGAGGGGLWDLVFSGDRDSVQGSEKFGRW